MFAIKLTSTQHYIYVSGLLFGSNKNIGDIYNQTIAFNCSNDDVHTSPRRCCFFSV